MSSITRDQPAAIQLWRPREIVSALSAKPDIREMADEKIV
jgi:hypothetical protein